MPYVIVKYRFILLLTFSGIAFSMSCGKENKPSDKLPEATVEGKLSKNGNPFEGTIRLKEKYETYGASGVLKDDVTIYARPGYIRREVKTEDNNAPVIGMIYKAGDSVVTIYGVSPKTNTRRHYRQAVASFNEEKESGSLYTAHNSNYVYIRPYSPIFYGMRSGCTLLKDSVYNAKMGPLSLKANYYALHSFTYSRAIWSPEIMIDTALVRMTEIWMPPDMPTLALYVNYYYESENASDRTLDKLLKKTNKLLPIHEEVILEAANAHQLSDADFLPPPESVSVAGEVEFTAALKNYREQTKTKVPEHTGNGHHHHHD